MIQVKNIGTQDYSQDAVKYTDITKLKVSINDKLDKILTLFKKDGIDGYLVNNGKLIEKDQMEESFAKLHICQNDRFAIVSTTKSITPLRWIRFPEFYLTDYFYMNTRYWDAMVFKPKCRVYFLGYGMLANYNANDMNVKIQWHIGEEVSEEYEINMVDADKDPEKKWFNIDIRDLGQSPILVEEGTPIHCKMKVTNDDHRRCFYGYSGYRDRYSVIDG